MHHVHVKIVIRADQQTVFQAISDHEKFLNRPEVKCQLIQEGFDSINGCGAIREVTLSWGTFQEEVTVFQALTILNIRFGLSPMLRENQVPSGMIEAGWIFHLKTREHKSIGILDLKSLVQWVKASSNG